MPDDTPVRCPLCGRTTGSPTDHHLLPKSKARGDKGRKRRQEVEDPFATEPLCWDCHRMVHSVLSTKELAAEYNTIEKLRSHPELAKFAAWVRKRPVDRRVRVRREKRRRR